MKINFSTRTPKMPDKRYITMRHFDIKRKFVPIAQFEKYVDWIDKQKKCGSHVITDIKQYNHENILDVLKILEQTSKNDSNIHKEMFGKLSHEEDKIIINEYNKLLDENINNLRTIRTFLEIFHLEDPVQELSHNIEDTNRSVVQEFHPHNGSLDGLVDSDIYTCIKELEGLKSSWRWTEDLLKCLIIHVRQASTYCQFHHDLHIAFEFIAEFRSAIGTDRHYDDSYNSALRLAGEIQAAEVALKYLRDKVTNIMQSLNHVVPVHLRTQSSAGQVSGVLICHYTSEEGELKAGEEVNVIDRGSLYTWKVKTGSGVVVSVPSIIIVIITGHDDDSARALIRLHEATEKLVDWTILTLNERLTNFLLKVFRNQTQYTKEEIQLICNLPSKTKMNLLNFFNTVMRSLPRVSRSREDIELEGRMASIREVVQLPHIDVREDKYKYGRCLVIQLNVLSYLVELFQGLKDMKEDRLTPVSTPRNKFKHFCSVLIQDVRNVKEDLFDLEEVITRIDEIITNSRMPKLVDDTLLKSSEIIKKHKSETSVTLVKHIKDLSQFARELESSRSKLRVQDYSEPLKTYVAEEHLSLSNGHYDMVDFSQPVPFQKLLWRRVNDSSGLTSQVKISETEQFFAIESEENKRYVIKSVVDPKTQEDISLSDSIKQGVVDASAGTYLLKCEPRETIPISAAMYQNLIKVHSVTVKKSWEKKSSVGLVTVKTKTKHKMKGWVETVCDFTTGSHIGLEGAQKKGIIDLNKNIYRDLKHKMEYTIDEADARGWIGRTEVPDEEDEPETKVTYVVWGVLDRRREKMLAYHEACKEGIMDRVTSAYFDFVTSKKYSIEEAIANDFVKAEVVQDPKTVDLWRDT